MVPLLDGVNGGRKLRGLGESFEQDLLRTVDGRTGVPRPSSEAHRAAVLALWLPVA
jgi:hypothetical protein